MKGVVYYRFGQYQQAISALTHAIQLNPSDRNYYLYRGIAYGKLNMFREAIADFDEAREAENGDYYENLKQADKNILEADYVAELSMATSAINYSPNDLIPHIYAGISLYNLSRASVIDPYNIDIFYNRSLAGLAVGHPERAISDITNVINSNPTMKSAYLHRASAYIISDMKEAAYLN